MLYNVLISKSVFKILENLSEPDYSRIKSSILSLSQNPRPKGCKKLKGRSAFRIRSGDYRIIYEIIDNKLIVNVIALGHRKDIYK